MKKLFYVLSQIKMESFFKRKSYLFPKSLKNPFHFLSAWGSPEMWLNKPEKYNFVCKSEVHFSLDRSYWKSLLIVNTCNKFLYGNFNGIYDTDFSSFVLEV